MNSLIEVVSFLRSELGEWPKYGDSEIEHSQYVLSWVLKWTSENIGLAVNSFDGLRLALILAYSEERSQRIDSLTEPQWHDFIINESANVSAKTGE